MFYKFLTTEEIVNLHIYKFCKNMNLKYLCMFIIFIFKFKVFKHLKLFILYIILIIIHHVIPFFLPFYCSEY